MKANKLAYLLFVCIVVVASCNKDVSMEPEAPAIPPNIKDTLVNNPRWFYGTSNSLYFKADNSLTVIDDSPLPISYKDVFTNGFFEINNTDSSIFLSYYSTKYKIQHTERYYGCFIIDGHIFGRLTADYVKERYLIMHRAP